jgi:hypothetical protein
MQRVCDSFVNHRHAGVVLHDCLLSCLVTCVFADWCVLSTVVYWTELALEWVEPQRAVMYDPTAADFFLQYLPGNPGGVGERCALGGKHFHPPRGVPLVCFEARLLMPLRGVGRAGVHGGCVCVGPVGVDTGQPLGPFTTRTRAGRARAATRCGIAPVCGAVQCVH